MTEKNHKQIKKEEKMGEYFSPMDILEDLGVSFFADEIYARGEKDRTDECRDQMDVVKSQLRPDEDGYLGENMKIVRLSLIMDKEEEELVAYKVDGKKRLHRLKDKSAEKDPDRLHMVKIVFSDRDAYAEDMKAKFAQNPPDGEFAITNYASNNFRLLDLRQPGIVKMYEIGVASQFGRQFLGLHLLGEAEAGWVRIKNAQRIRFNMRCGPNWNRWYDFCDEIAELAGEGRFRPKSDFVQERAADNSSLRLKPGQAMVKFFNIISGTGALKLAENATLDGEPFEGDAKLHWAQVYTQLDGERVELAPGQMVLYDRLERIEQDEETKNPTAFRCQAIGVTPV